jgi:hypothetical protein
VKWHVHSLPSRFLFLAAVFILCALIGPTGGFNAANADIDLDGFEDFAPPRRDSPSKDEEGLFAFPIYTHVPGVGSTVGFGFLRSKIFQTKANALAAATVGDSSLFAGGITDVNAFSEHLFFNFFAYATKIPFQLYARGKASTEDGFTNLLRQEYGATAEAKLRYFGRRVEATAMIAPSRLRTAGASLPDGTRFSNNDNNEVSTLGTTLRFQVDLTDDDQDPRHGAKFQFIYHRSDLRDDLHSQYGSLNAFATGYVPVKSRGVLAFHLFRSSAIVAEQNNRSDADIRAGIGLGCAEVSGADAQVKCKEAEDRRVTERAAENRYGTAALLGGPTQLRGYPIGRFRGSQSLMYAAEFRQNLGEENVMFDYGFIHGMRSLLQVAPFIELGAATDPPETVETAPLHTAYGIGFRMGFSGTLLRLDVGTSNEGPEFTFFVGYPWDLSIL